MWERRPGRIVRAIAHYSWWAFRRGWWFVLGFVLLSAGTASWSHVAFAVFVLVWMGGREAVRDWRTKRNGPEEEASGPLESDATSSERPREALPR